MVELDAVRTTFLFLLPLFVILLFRKLLFSSTTDHQTRKTNPRVPNSFPVIGSYLAVRRHTKDVLQWMTSMLRASPTSTVVVQKPFFGGDHIVTADPANVEHLLKTKFSAYEKGDVFTTTLRDLLGHGIFNVDSHAWKFQRQVASYEFSSKSLRKFVEQVVDTELEQRLIPILAQSVGKGKVFDLQDLLKRFAFDNICKIAFGYDPALLLPSLPVSKFANAFEDGVAISSMRFRTVHPITWRIKRLLNIGSEKLLRKSVSEVRDFASEIVKNKKEQMNLNNQSENSSIESGSDLDLLSRFLKSGHTDEQFLTDIVISFILAGRDTSSAALTWFFWLLAKNPEAEREIVEEIKHSDENPNGSAYDHAKDLVYTHAALHESMRFYPPVVADSKQLAGDDDVWPDGSVVRKGSTVAYHVYAMGRMEGIWGKDWAEFRPERWLEETEEGGERRKVFKARDPYTYPVFQAGPRVCIGKEMALLQMKMVAAGILRRFRVVPATAKGFEPVLLPYLTAVMEGGFPVRFERRA